MSKSIEFFATYKDLGQIFETIEASLPIHYVNPGLEYAPRRQAYSSYRQIPDFGRPRIPEKFGEHRRFAMLKTDDELQEVSFLDRQGVQRYELDTSTHNWTILDLGGMYGVDTLLLPSSFGLAPNLSDNKFDSSALDVFRAAEKAVSVYCVQQRNGYFLASEAVEYLKQGGRLTNGMQCPPELDLKY